MGSATTPNGSDWHVTSVKLTRDEHAALKRIAEADKRSLSNELRYLIVRRDDELEARAA